MAKIALTKLGLKPNVETKTIEWNGQNIEIKQYLNLEEKLNLISLIISIGITFIPILTHQIETIKLSLVSKGIKYNSIKNIYYMIKTLIPNLFKKIND